MRIGVKVQQNGTARSQLLDHILLRHLSVGALSDVVGVFCTSDGLAARPTSATLDVNGCLILSTLFGDSAILFKEKSIEVTPTTVASLVHVVAIEALLSG